MDEMRKYGFHCTDFHEIWSLGRILWFSTELYATLTKSVGKYGQNFIYACQ